MSIPSWLKRRRLDDRDFDEEMRSHLAIAAAERMADGADRESAQLASRKEFGNLTLTAEAAHRVWTPWWVDILHDQVSDVRYAIRALARNPGFSLTVVLVLALGVGLNATVFTMLKGFALSPLAGVENSASLHAVMGETGSGRDVRLSYPDYQYVRDHDRGFSGLLGSTLVLLNMGRGRAARPVSGELVTGNYFHVLGVRAQLGRTLLPSDEVAPGRHPVIVLGDGLWRREFGGDRDIVGKTVDINNYRLTVVGVADASFHGTIVSYDIEVFIPVMMASQIGLQNTPSADPLSDRRVSLLTVLGHLRPGVSLATAAAQIDALGAVLAQDRPLADAVQRLRVLPFSKVPNSGQSYVLPTVTVLSAMGLLVLVLACANIAGLVLVRGMSRRGEIAVRLALGATRPRIVRLLIVENLVLAVPGAILGVLLAWQGIPVLVEYAEWLAAPLRLYMNLRVDGAVIGFAAAIAIASALVFGFVPALQSSRIDLVSVINEDASPRGAARGRLRAALVVAQVAVSLLLLVGAGLATRTNEAARRANPGFDAAQVTSVGLDLRQNGFDEARGSVFYRNLLEAARADAGIESATLAAFTPMGMVDTRAQRVEIDGYAVRRGEDLSFMVNTIGPDYFRTLRIRVAAGREFSDRDDPAGAPVAIVNETFAQKFWGGAANAIGKRLRAGDGQWRTVVGVAGDIKYSRINESPRPYFYLPLFQSYRSSMVLHTRGSAPLPVLLDQARARIAALDPDLAIAYARSLTEKISGALIFFNVTATMLFVFGLAGMALAAMGTYGLVSYTVKQSTHEIGIRMALGASALSVVRRFVGRGVRLGAIGAGLGLVAALAATRLLTGVLYGVSATDPISFARALAIVLAVVAAATLVPAWRAARTDPLSALRHQ